MQFILSLVTISTGAELAEYGYAVKSKNVLRMSF